MVKSKLCSWLPLLFLWRIEALGLEALIDMSSIYYLRAAKLGEPSELLLQHVDELPAAVSTLKLIVHGFFGSRTHSSILPLRNAYEAQGFEHVLVADWSPAANLDYATSRHAIAKVAAVLANQLQQFLAKHNVSAEAVHIVGHSLGAHIAGRIGHQLKGAVGRITGLDPALPLFTPLSEDSLKPNAARFVDVIHTDFPLFGDLTPRGTVDFYPNFGHAPQPGCEEVDLLVASKLILEAYSCSHNRAVLFYAESIGLPKNFPTIPCSWKAIIGSRSCFEAGTARSFNGSLDESHMVYMGEHVSRSATSYYYLETNAAPPFGQGANAKFN